MAVFTLVKDILIAFVWLIVFIGAVMIGTPIAFIICLVKRDKRFGHYWNETVMAIIHPFFPTFGH